MINIFIRPKWVLSLQYAFDFWINCIHQSGNDFQRKILFVVRWIPPLKNCKKYYLPRRIHVLCWKRLSQVRTPSESLDLINTAPENGVILNYIFTCGNLISKVIKDEGLSNLMAFYVKQEVTRINWMIPNIVTSVVRVKLFFTRIDFLSRLIEGWNFAHL